MSETPKQRQCGSCKACCTTLIVAEIEKKEFERCKHLGPVGCRIYSKRPEQCRGYGCLWLMGLGGKRERPDRLGVVLSPAEMPDLGFCVMVHEVERGAMKKPRVQQVISALAQKEVVLHIQRDSMRRLIGGPRDKVLRMSELARKTGQLRVGGVEPGPDVPIERVLQEAQDRKP